MSTRLISRIAAYDILIARCFLFIIGCIAVWWGIVSFLGQQSLVERIANRVIAGESFNRATLAQQLPIIESIERAAWCQPAALRSAAIIQLRMIDVAGSTNDHKPTDADLKSLGSVIQNSLSCSPADPFLWLVLYWVENMQNGFKPEHLKYLELSFQLGPNEGWVALKRSPVVFADYERLSSGLKENAFNEFLGLINHRFYEQAADIFTGPAWRVRDTLLPHLVSLPLQNRETFARALYKRGFAVPIPGVEPPDSDPQWWRR